MTGKQLSPEWFAQRVGRITGSVAGAILGLSPWQKPDDVIRTMVRNSKGLPSEMQDNPAMSFGRAHETAAILEFSKQTGLEVQEVGFLPYEEWLGASPDGLVSDNSTLEIKVPYGMRNKPVPDFKTLKEQPHYYAQVQLEMLCSGRNRAWFAQYRPAIGDIFGHDYQPAILVTEQVEQDQEWLDTNLPLLKQFYESYLQELDNPLHLEPLRVQLWEPEHQALINYIDEMQEAESNAKQARQDAINKLIEMAGEKDADVCGRKLTKVVRKGSISSAKLLKMIDLSPEEQEAMRGKESVSWRLS